MRWASWLVACWPGMAAAARHGSLRGLALAVAAGLALDVVLVVTFGWDELVGASVRNALWLVLGAFWLAGLVLSASWEKSTRSAAHCPSTPDNFPAALDYYLKGDWLQAERLLRERLDACPRDVESRLLLTGLFRHTRRWEEAAVELGRLQSFEESARWDLEIRRECELLAQRQTAEASDGADEAAAGIAVPDTTANAGQPQAA